MIETLPLLPALPTPTRGPAADPGRADFGQWLASPPAAGGQSASPLVPAIPGDDFAGVPVAGAPSLAPPVGIVAEAGRGTVPMVPLPGTSPTFVPQLSNALLPPVVVHLTLPVVPTLPTPANAPVAALETLPAAGDAHPLWTLASRSGGETVDLFFSPWQLVAGHRLSQQSRSRLPGIAQAAMPGVVPSSPLGVPAAAGAAASVALASRVDRPGMAVLAPAMAWVTAARSSGASGATAEAIGSGQPALGAAAAWPLRLLRWLNEGPHGATAWLRDFTLASDALPSLVDDLRRFAAEQDITLHRIVLNGRTLWTSAPPLDSPPDLGDSHAS